MAKGMTIEEAKKAAAAKNQPKIKATDTEPESTEDEDEDTDEDEASARHAFGSCVPGGECLGHTERETERDLVNV